MKTINFSTQLDRKIIPEIEYLSYRSLLFMVENILPGVNQNGGRKKKRSRKEKVRMFVDKEILIS